MKDDRLEKQFDEYFEGVNTPDNITADAKKYVKSKSAFMPRFVKFASIAASFVLVFAVSLVIVLNTRSPITAPDEANGAQVSVYSDADLSFNNTDVYTITKLNNSLKFIEDFAFSGASVNNCSAGYKNGELAIVKADVSLIYELSRHDTQVYVEFTDENSVYSPLKDYADGVKGTYKDINYFITTETAENGEPVNKLYFTYNNVKYYFNITSSDENAYLKYLQFAGGY